MTRYGVTTDYDYSAEHMRHRIRVWSGAWYGAWEADGYSLPNNAGYMLTTYNGDKIRVLCPCPRGDDNWQAVDDAISDALVAHYEKRGVYPGPNPFTR
ncbi:MAG: hypothetical protein M0R06_15545 [Sphaerochaeta sp.]|jgi:hypothetical protein|nr:hypothetical protein [Sphaerochaeta sp.]